MASIAAELTSLQQQVETSQHTFEVLQSSWYVTEEEESEAFWAMRRWPNKLSEVGLHAPDARHKPARCLHKAGVKCISTGKTQLIVYI